LDKAVELIQQWGGKLAELAQQVGPEVAQVALTALAIQHLGQLAIGALLVVIGTVFAVYSTKAFKAAYRVSRDYELTYSERDSQSFNRGFLGAILLCGAVVCLGVGLLDKLFNIWNWAALYDPRLIIAKRVLGL
jgi:hypothetical protein